MAEQIDKLEHEEPEFLVDRNLKLEKAPPLTTEEEKRFDDERLNSITFAEMVEKFQRSVKRTDSLSNKDVLRILLTHMTGSGMRLLKNACGIASEGGELINIIKKNVFQGQELDVDQVKDETGDLLYYVLDLIDVFGFNLEDLLRYNMAKRKLRYPDGFKTDGTLFARQVENMRREEKQPKYQVNINYHPDYAVEPRWEVFTKSKYCALHGLSEEEWAELSQAGAVVRVPD